MTTFNISIVSDAICPWCYVGKKRLERAIETYKRDIPGAASDTFNITWHPFYLDPTLPKAGIDRNVHLAKRYGAERTAMVTARLKSLGEAEGIKFSLLGKIGNTRDVHRLVQLAKTKSNEAENRLMSTIFQSHFEEDADITSQDALVAMGEKAGLDRAEVRDWLSQGKGGAEVDREVEEAYRESIHAVPNFIINGKFQVEGALDAQQFVEAFAKAKESSPDVSAATSKGASC